jgi:hypothetical protein
MVRRASPLEMGPAGISVSKLLGALLSVAAAAALMGVVYGPLSNESLHEPATRLIIAAFPGLIAVAFALGAAAAFARRAIFAWWALGCFLAAIFYAAVIIAGSSLLF